MRTMQAVIGKLRGNAIEYSDRRIVLVRLDFPVRVVIENPGHGVSAERSARATRACPAPATGLRLIGRRRKHLQWQPGIAFDHDQGTTTVLDSKPASR